MKVYVTGANGFLGRAVCTHLATAGVQVRGMERGPDLRDLIALTRALRYYDSQIVVHCAMPRSDGISTMMTTPADFANACLLLDMNVLRACASAGVQRVIGMGSVCAYPEYTAAPTTEDQFWNGYPEPVNAPYGMAKRMQAALLMAYQAQGAFRAEHLILANLYGPGDTSGHVIPSLINRMLTAKAAFPPEPVTVWGHPDVTRSFLYIDDAAEAVAQLVMKDPYKGIGKVPLVNLASNVTATMKDLAYQIAGEVGLNPSPHSIVFDTSKPTGHRSRRFDTAQLEAAIGWTARTTLPLGLARTVDWMRAQRTTPVEAP